MHICSADNYGHFILLPYFIINDCLQDTGSILLPTDIKYYQVLGAGGEKVIFEAEETKELKNFGKPGIIFTMQPPHSGPLGL